MNDGPTLLYIGGETENVLINLLANDAEIINMTLNVPHSAETDDSRADHVWDTIQILATLDWDKAEEVSRKLENYFVEALHNTKTNTGPRYFIYWRSHTTGPLRRSRIQFGRVHLSSEMISAALGLSRRNPRVPLTVYIKRDGWWELPEVAIPLTNRYGTNVTNGLRVDNHSDGSHDNFVLINGNDIAGGMPAAVRLEIRNTHDNSVRASHHFIGHNVYSDAHNFSHIVQGQDGNLGSQIANSDASGGAFRRREWSGSSEQTIIYWELTKNQMDQMGGRFFRLILYLFNALSVGVTDLQIRWRITIQGIQPLHETDWLHLPHSNRIIDTASIPISPLAFGNLAEYYPLRIELQGRRLGGASTTFDTDFAQLTPTDSFRQLRSVGFNLAYQTYLVDDYDSEPYTVGWSPEPDGRAGNYMGRGKPIRLVPGRDQALYFLIKSTSNDHLDRTSEVKLFYRPKTRTI